MAGLRGSNINASDFADNDVVMQLISVSDGDGESLPLDYDPQMISEYWGRRPVSVITRLAQLVGGHCISTARSTLLAPLLKITRLKLQSQCWKFLCRALQHVTADL